jgi:CubicO group peptidase (beta-lactamase class C family)
MIYKIFTPALFIALLLPLFVAGQSLDTLLKNATITGAQIVFEKNGKQQSFHYGKNNADEVTAVTASSVFQAASLSKVVLAYITLKLYDKKILSLDTPLLHYFDYSRIKKDSNAAKITARMVLHHQSGLPNWADNPTSKTWASSALKTKNIPGTTWSYSGEGFMFLQFAIENLLKQSLEDIAATEVFKPLQMHSTSFVWKEQFEATGTYGHNKKGEVNGRPEFFSPSGAYSLMTTAKDFTIFLQALLNGNGLTKATHQMMFNDTVSVINKAAADESFKHIFWGLGIGIQQNEKGKAIWHWGDNDDYKCFFLAFPKKKESLLYLTNSQNGLDVMDKVLTHYFGKQNWWAFDWLDKNFK